MDMFVALAERSFLAFGLLLLLVQLAFHEVGYRLGFQNKASAATQSESVGLMVGGILGLLAFVLALTLSFASNRYSDTRQGVLVEANAIGTAWLRAGAIGMPRGDEVARLLEQYAKLRLDFVRAGRDEARLASLNQATNALQSKIWGNVAAIVREQPSDVTSSMMESVNEVFDAATAERLSYARKLPPQVFWLLMGMTVLGMSVLGYQMGLKGRTIRPMVVLLTVMWTVIIVDILDLASARFGSFRTSTAAYEWTIQGFQGGVHIPPLQSR